MASRLIRRAVPITRQFLSRQGSSRWHHCSGETSDYSQSDIHSIPLTTPLPWLKSPEYQHFTSSLAETKVTTLSNGIRVASEQKFGHFCTVGVLIDSGSRYEVHYPSGVSHFLEKLAYASTTKFASKDAILRALEAHGGICDAQGSRDTLIYAVSGRATGLNDILETLAESVLEPRITDQEIAECRQIINFELDSLDLRPDPEPILVELIHTAAYNNNTLGLPKICPRENINVIDRSTLLDYMNNYHSPDRIVVAGVGVDHDDMVKAVEKQFGTRKPTWHKDDKTGSSKKKDLSLAQYTGGIVQVSKDLSDVSLGPTPMPELVHLVIALESCSHRDDEFVPTCVLNMMLGGGGSFSAGGPGKGMYTRLYLNVLNKFHWIHNATAYNHAYADTGIFCIHASCPPSKLRDLTEVIGRELSITRNEATPSELSRAKTQLKSMLMMNLETRPVSFEDIGRQVLASGCRKQPQYYCNLIDKVTSEDIQRVANKMLHSKPSVAIYGDQSRAPSYEFIQSVISGNEKKRFSLFTS